MIEILLREIAARAFISFLKTAKRYSSGKYPTPGFLQMKSGRWLETCQKSKVAGFKWLTLQRSRFITLMIPHREGDNVQIICCFDLPTGFSNSTSLAGLSTRNPGKPGVARFHQQ